MVYYRSCYRVQGTLSVSRSIGDKRLKQYVPSQPECIEHKVTHEDEFIILATDGLWCVLTSQEAVELARHCASATEASELLTNTALHRRSMDNLAVIVIPLNWPRGLARAELPSPHAHRPSPSPSPSPSPHAARASSLSSSLLADGGSQEEPP